MKTKVLYLFALTFSLTLSSCKKDPTPISTTITGKVVTFREDSLYYNGPIDVALYSSSMDWPIEKLETKTIYPPYNFEFVTDYTDPIDKEFVLDVETNIPEHKWHYPSDGPWISRGGSHEVEINIMPKTAIQYELINEDPQPGDFIALNRIGGGAYTVTSPYQIILDEGWYNGAYPLHYNVSTNGEADFRVDTIQLSPFDTAYYTIRY